MEKIKLTDVINAVSGVTVGNSLVTGYIAKIVIDSRKKTTNGLFFAIKGENTDGHKYIDSAIKNGCTAVVISEEQQEYATGVTYILVKDTLQALRDLAMWYRSNFNIPVVAITGSVGKTTTKDMVASVLKKEFNVLKTDGNYNSETGVPLTVFRMNKSQDIAVIEMGMDHAGQIDSSSKIVTPDMAVITNIGIAHIEYLKTRENILKAKCEVIKNIKLGGTLILNADDDMLQTVKTDVNTVWYGVENKANVFAKNVEVDYTNAQVKAMVNINNKSYNLLIPGFSKHLVYAALAGISVGLQYGMEIEEILDGILHYEHTKMRMDIHKLNKKITLIDDTYNANPASMKSLIDTVSKCNVKNRTVILGDMYELGEESHKAHMDLLVYASNSLLDNIYIIGENMQKAYMDVQNKEKIKYFFSKEELYSNIDKLLVPDSIIAVKASRGMKFEDIIEKVIEIDKSL